MAANYFELKRREPFKPKSWQSKSWKYGTEGIDWTKPGYIQGRSGKPMIKRVVIAYKAYIKRDNGSKRIIGKLKTRKSVNYHCVADNQQELEDLLQDVKELEKMAKRADENSSGKLKHIVKCLVIFDDATTDCIISLSALHKYFRRD
ncbi:MAG: hypothetical protein NC311_05645 [Muribaculaceae bacterium]|nr:hypothetical protein [Muribaculaceae bacterium]